MPVRLYVIIASTCLSASTLAHAACTSDFNDQLIGAEIAVDSLKPDKPGQQRVFAADGSEFTAGEAQWMKGKLKSAQRACSDGDERTASASLRGVVDLLKSHRHR